MTDKVRENNQVTVMGEIVGEFVYSHEIFGEGFYIGRYSCAKAQRFIRQDTAYDLRKADGCFKGLQRNTRHGKRTVQVL